MNAVQADPPAFGGHDPDRAVHAAICSATPTKCQARTRLYRGGVLEAEGFPVDDISEHLKDPTAVIWLDLRDPDREDLAVLQSEFGLHPLAVEDAVQEHERPKLDRYRSHLFVTAYAVQLDAGDRRAGDQRAGRVRHPAGADHRAQGRRASTSAPWWPTGTPAQTWPSTASATCCTGLLDYVVDGHFTAVQALDDEIEALEDLLFDDESRATERAATQLRAAQEPGAAAPGRAADARGRQLADAPRPAHRRRATAAVLPGRLRPRAARHRVDREPARPGHHDPGDQPDHPGQPA